MPRLSSIPARRSLFSIDTVPIRIGRPLRCRFLICARGIVFAPCFLTLEIDGVVALLQQRAGNLAAVRQFQNVPAVQVLDLVGDGDELLALAAVDHVGVLQRCMARLVGIATTSSL
jgi:hypothetical protein